MKLVGADYHGTYDTHPELEGEVDIIITGESWEDFQKIEDEWEGEELPIYFNPQRSKDTNETTNATWKADMINKLGVTDYYEDQHVQVNLIKLLAKNCKVHEVK